MTDGNSGTARCRADDRHCQRLPTPEEDPSYCKFLIERRVNCGVRHQASTVGAAELVGAAVGHAPCTPTVDVGTGLNTAPLMELTLQHSLKRANVILSAKMWPLASSLIGEVRASIRGVFPTEFGVQSGKGTNLFPNLKWIQLTPT